MKIAYDTLVAKALSGPASIIQNRETYQGRSDVVIYAILDFANQADHGPGMLNEAPANYQVNRWCACYLAGQVMELPSGNPPDALGAPAACW